MWLLQYVVVQRDSKTAHPQNWKQNPIYASNDRQVKRTRKKYIKEIQNKASKLQLISKCWEKTDFQKVNSCLVTFIKKDG